MEWGADGAVSRKVGCNQELQIIQPGCHEECRADRHVKEAGKDTTSEGSVFSRLRGLDPIL